MQVLHRVCCITWYSKSLSSKHVRDSFKVFSFYLIVFLFYIIFVSFTVFSCQLNRHLRLFVEKFCLQEGFIINQLVVLTQIIKTLLFLHSLEKNIDYILDTNYPSKTQYILRVFISYWWECFLAYIRFGFYLHSWFNFCYLYQVCKFEYIISIFQK